MGLLLWLWQLSQCILVRARSLLGFGAWWYLLVSGDKKPQLWLLLATLELMEVHSMPWHTRDCSQVQVLLERGLQKWIAVSGCLYPDRDEPGILR